MHAIVRVTEQKLSSLLSALDVQWTPLQLSSFAIAHAVLLVFLLLKNMLGEQLQMSPL